VNVKLAMDILVLSERGSRTSQNSYRMSCEYLQRRQGSNRIPVEVLPVEPTVVISKALLVSNVLPGMVPEDSGTKLAVVGVLRGLRVG